MFFNSISQWETITCGCYGSAHGQYILTPSVCLSVIQTTVYMQIVASLPPLKFTGENLLCIKQFILLSDPTYVKQAQLSCYIEKTLGICLL